MRRHVLGVLASPPDRALGLPRRRVKVMPRRRGAASQGEDSTTSPLEGGLRLRARQCAARLLRLASISSRECSPLATHRSWNAPSWPLPPGISNLLSL
eukprot:7558064-Pyramimonas_sp.AAC.1